MRRHILTFSLAAILAASVSHASPDAGIDTGTTEKLDESQDLSNKKSLEHRHSDTSKKSKSITKGVDKQTQEALKQLGQTSKSGTLDLSVTPDTIFLKRLKELEAEAPLAACGVLRHPRLGKDFGLSAEVSPGVYDTVKAEILSKAASSNASLESVGVGDGAVVAYMQCLATYGGIVRQAYLNLYEDLAAVGAARPKAKKGGATPAEISGLGYADFVSLAKGALDRAAQGAGQIRGRVADQMGDLSCRLEGKTEQIQCGDFSLTLGTRPALVSGATSIYGAGGYEGIQASFRLASGWSYQDSVERMKSLSRFEKFADEVARAAEDLEAQGRSRDAVMLRKRAVEAAKAGKNNVSVAGLMPSLHN